MDFDTAYAQAINGSAYLFFGEAGQQLQLPCALRSHCQGGQNTLSIGHKRQNGSLPRRFQDASSGRSGNRLVALLPPQQVRRAYPEHRRDACHDQQAGVPLTALNAAGIDEVDFVLDSGESLRQLEMDRSSPDSSLPFSEY